MEISLPFFLLKPFLADADYPHDAASVETKTAPVQSLVVMECRTDLRAPVKFTWSRQGGILPKVARVEGVSIKKGLKNKLFSQFFIFFSVSYSRNCPFRK